MDDDPALYIEDEKKPELVAKERPDVESTPKFKEKKEWFIGQIDPLLEKNAAIDPASHCEDPFMLVKLKVKPGTIVHQPYRRRFAQIEQDEINQTIETWKKTGVVVPTPPGVPHQNQITCSARRDLEGRIMKYRVCLDPRHLNSKLTEYDQFPLPIIHDILESASGHKYFSTIDLRQAYHRLPLDKESQPYTAFYCIMAKSL